MDLDHPQVHNMGFPIQPFWNFICLNYNFQQRIATDLHNEYVSTSIFGSKFQMTSFGYFIQMNNFGFSIQTELPTLKTCWSIIIAIFVIIY